MDTNNFSIPNSETTKYNYDVLIEQKGKDKITATLLGWQDFQTEGATKEEALDKLRQILNKRLQKTEIVSLEIELPQTKHPWMEFAGMYKDNPLFDEVLEDIQTNRQKIDQENQGQDTEVEEK